MAQERCQEVKKMKQGMSYSCKEKTIILNVFKYLKNVYPEKCVTEIVRRTAKATGCSEKSVFQFRKEEASAEGFREPSKKKIRKNININSRFNKYDENVRQSLRHIISDLKSRNIIPSLSVILKNVNANDELPNFSLMTLRRLLFDMGFIYEKEKNGNKSILVEKIKMEVKKENKPLPKRNHSDIKHNTVQNIPQEMPKQPPQAPPHIQPTIQHPTQNNMNVHQNQIYMHNQTHRAPIPHHYDNHMMDPRMDQMQLQHSMMMNHRMPHHPHQIHHPVGHHNMGFMPHGSHPHNIIMQQ